MNLVRDTRNTLDERPPMLPGLLALLLVGKALKQAMRHLLATHMAVHDPGIQPFG